MPEVDGRSITLGLGSAVAAAYVFFAGLTLIPGLLQLFRKFLNVPVMLASFPFHAGYRQRQQRKADENVHSNHYASQMEEGWDGRMSHLAPEIQLALAVVFRFVDNW